MRSDAHFNYAPPNHIENFLVLFDAKKYPKILLMGGGWGVPVEIGGLDIAGGVLVGGGQEYVHGPS